jgi:hypothetical protein
MKVTIKSQLHIINLAILFSALTISFPTYSGTHCDDHHLIQGETFDEKPKPYNVALSPAWDDERLLRSFGLDIKKAKIQNMSGVDGHSIEYKYSQKTVTITRSSSGLSVMLSGPRFEAVHWDLGVCER